MLWRRARVLVLLWCAAGACAAAPSRYAFYRNMRGELRRRWPGTPRRVFGGAPTALDAFPAACVIMDRYWSPRCSGSVLAPRWVLTAAHCVSRQAVYVMYNSRHPTAHDGDVSPVSYLYRHPSYKVVQEDEGRGLDVTLLNHDVGLLRTSLHMKLASAPPTPALRSMTMYNLEKLQNEEVQVLGYGRTEAAFLGEQLFAVRLRLVPCARASWQHCMCGLSAAHDSTRGVCSGDSGGPVLYRGVQVGVTSMGPLECAEGQADPAETATSVFTSLYQYAPLVNATMQGTEQALQMRRLIAGAPLAPRLPPALAAGAALLAHLYSCNVHTY